jgi:hypothetical protein
MKNCNRKVYSVSLRLERIPTASLLLRIMPAAMNKSGKPMSINDVDKSEWPPEGLY